MNVAVIDKNMKVINVIVYNDDVKELSSNEILIKDGDLAYIGGDYYNGYFYPPSPGPNYERDGKGNWITDNPEKVPEFKIIEDVWDPEKKEIISRVEKNISDNDLISTRFDNDNNLLETYKNISISEIDNQFIKNLHDPNFYSDLVLFSTNTSGKITDYYFDCDLNMNNIPKEVIEKYNLNLNYVKSSVNLFFRFNTLGEFIGNYYVGSWELLELKYKDQYNDFLNILKNHYKHKRHYANIVKDFGNNAAYMFHTVELIET
jgi:hypothetical protein